MQRTMYIVRGASGSGKTTKAQTLGGTVYSADDFFMHNGTYLFDPTLLGQAHQASQDAVKAAAGKGESPIIVDNTNTQLWEMRPYVVVGLVNGYTIQFVEPDSPWWKTFHSDMSNEELEELVQILADKSSCNVPLHTIGNTLVRWDFNPTVEKVLHSKRSF